MPKTPKEVFEIFLSALCIEYCCDLLQQCRSVNFGGHVHRVYSTLFQILWVVNITWFKWLLVVAGALLSGGVLVIALWPAVRDDTRQMAYLVAGLVFLFHLMLAAGFVVRWLRPRGWGEVLDKTRAPDMLHLKLASINTTCVIFSQNPMFDYLLESSQ